jgi:chromatin remodeling complex protein RSC6
MIENITQQFDDIIININTFKTQLTLLQTQIKNIDKHVKREFKNLKKESSKNKGNKKPSGFATPTKITTELCEFMNKENGSKIARTDVTKSVIEYIKTNNLQNSINKQIIHPDEKLQILLGINDDDQLTYFTLQKYMNKHFLKNEKIIAEI